MNSSKDTSPEEDTHMVYLSLATSLKELSYIK